MPPMTPSSLFTGPYFGPSAKKQVPYVGPAMRCFKRTLWRAGRFPWNEKFNESFNRLLEESISKLQRDSGYDSSGIIGEKTFRLLTQLKDKDDPTKLAMDDVAVNFLEDDWEMHHPPLDPPIERVREALREWLLATVDAADKWHYTQNRPGSYNTFVETDPRDGGQGDCSLHPLFGAYWVRNKTGIKVPDPMGRGFDRWGNSDTLLDMWAHAPVRSGNYEIGDIAIYGPSWKTKHVTQCSERGRAGEAEFTSHGSEAGPYQTRVYYRDDLLVVVRPQLVPVTA